MYLCLIRHGESVGNAQKLFFGQWDCPLTQRGWQQAWQTAQKLRQVSFTRCCASDLSRAWETAEVCLTGRQIVLERCPGLRELFLGNLEQKTWNEAWDLYGDYLHCFLNDWYHSAIPTAELPADMKARVAACVEKIITRGEDTLVVAHNGTLMLLYHLGLIGDQQLFNTDFYFQFGCYSVVRIDWSGVALEGFNL